MSGVLLPTFICFGTQDAALACATQLLAKCQLRKVLALQEALSPKSAGSVTLVVAYDGMLSVL